MPYEPSKDPKQHGYRNPDIMSEFLFITGLLSAAILVGSMVFFSWVMAPLIFIKLDETTAGPFVRSIFPWYYLVIIGLSFITHRITDIMIY